MEITENYTESTSLYVRHGFTVSPKPSLDERAAVEDEIRENHGVVGRFVQADWQANGVEVEIVTENDGGE